MTLPTVHPFLLDLLNGTGAEDLVLPPPEDQMWRAIIGEADRHGLAPILYRWLNDSGRASRLPPAALDELKARVSRLTARNLVLAQEAASILKTFESRRVVCAPIRGLTLAELLYGEITARPMGDVDLLVRKNDLPGVASALRDLGFEEMDRRPGFAQAYSYTLKFIKDRHGWIIVEPHWTLAYPPFAGRLDMDAVWERCVRGRVLGMETWLLSREDMVLNLCLHLIHRGESAPLLWFYELDRLLRHPHDALNWEGMLRIAEGSGLEGLLLEGLGYVKNLFASPIPDEVFDRPLKAVPRNRLPSNGAWLERRLVGLLAGESRADGRESLALLFVIKGVRAKLRYALALLFPSAEFMRLQYGASSTSRIGFRYLGRTAYLAWEGFKGILCLLALRRSGSSAAP
jgi:hypothetical protein